MHKSVTKTCKHCFSLFVFKDSVISDQNAFFIISLKFSAALPGQLNGMIVSSDDVMISD